MAYPALSHAVRSQVPLCVDPSLHATLRNCFGKLVPEGKTPGLTCGIITRDGRYSQFVDGVRLANPAAAPSVTSTTAESSNDVKEGDRFHIGSATKSMTCSMMGALEAQFEKHPSTCVLASALPGPFRLNTTTLFDVWKAVAETPGAATPYFKSMFDSPNFQANFTPDHPLLSQPLEQFLNHRSGLDDAASVYGYDFSTWGRCPRSTGRVLSQLWRNGINAVATVKELWHPMVDHEACLLQKYPELLSAHTSGGDSTAWSQAASTLYLMSLVAEGGCLATPEARAAITRGRGEWKYSNYGYALAANAMELATGKSYARLMQEALFDPLEMSSAGFGEPLSLLPTGGEDSSGVNNAVRGHVNSLAWKWEYPFAFEQPKPLPASDKTLVPTALAPAGNVCLATADWLKFLHHHLIVSSSSSPSSDNEWYTSRDPFTPPGKAKPKSSKSKKGTSTTTPSTGFNYRYGLILDDSTAVKAMQSLGEEGNNTKGEKETKKGVEVEFGKHPLPFNVSHDGSTGAWYAYCAVVPEWGVAACGAFNSIHSHSPASLSAAVREALYQCRQEEKIIHSSI